MTKQINQPKTVDTVIHAEWIIPVTVENPVLTEHAIAIDEGRIVEILPTNQAEKYLARETINLPGHALIPGLINAHTHSAMTLLRGIADDLPLMDWLNNHIWPAEQAHVSAEFCFDGSLLACAEMIRSGTTCFNDMYFFPEETGRAAEQAGIRAKLGLIMIDFPSAWAANADEYISKGIELHDHLHNNPLITTAFAPHAPYTVSDEPLKRIVTYAEELDIPIHMHVHETSDEVTQAEEQTGQRPLQRLEELGLLSPRLLAVHMTQLTNEEIQHCAETGVNVIHCPESNMKLASGFCPVADLDRAGVNVAIGTDGTASNNDLDMLAEMRSAALIAKAVANDASAIPAETALRMATINGAKALGLENETGSLETGKYADITAIDLSGFENQPVYNPVSQIVYSASRHHVSNVWVAGNQVLKNQAFTTLDINAITANAKQWRDKINNSNN